jgi:hypothetical protein
VTVTRRFCVIRTIAATILSLLCLAILEGCARASNFPDANWERRGDLYIVTLKGRRVLMAHDPISLLLGETYEESAELRLPRLQGSIPSEEIPVKEGDQRLSGRVEISGDRMLVDFHRILSDGTLDPSSWNGEYRLHPDPREGMNRPGIPGGSGLP